MWYTKPIRSAWGRCGVLGRERQMPAKVGFLVIDAQDPQRLADFWGGLLATTVAESIGDGQFIVMAPTEDGLTVGFQKVPETKAGKNRLHLDLVVDDLDASTTEIEALGGRWLEPGSTRELEGFLWRCMADPEGNDFDIDVLPG
jgi:predicted enzyme related to lactoylglutathione lyase